MQRERSGCGSTFTHELTSKRANVAVLCRLEDAALKFRGCFQAICELRSEHQKGGRGREREGVAERVAYGRQGVVVLEPTYAALRAAILPLFLILSSGYEPLPPSSHPVPFLSLFAPLRASPHFLSHFHCLVTPVRPLARATLCLLCIRGTETNSYLLMSFS